MKFDEAKQLKAPCTQDLQYCPGTGVHVEGDSRTPGERAFMSKAI